MGDSIFEDWLSEKFRQLNTDESVFVPYITSILEGDEESKEEKDEAIDGILAELAEQDGSLDVEAFRKEILSRWELKLKQKAALVREGSGEGSVVDTNKFAELLQLNEESSCIRDQAKSRDQPDKDLRAAILNQYKDSSDNESEGDEPAGTSSSGTSRGGGFSSSGLERNTNAERVQNEMKDKREQEKADAAKKREKDREDRAKQKQQAQDRKDKAKKKAAKVERKR